VGYLPDFSEATKIKDRKEKNVTKITLILSLILAAGFAFFGVQKFGAENIVFETLADRSGLSLFEPTIRYVTGLAELTVAVLFLIPRTRLLAALGGLAILVGAIGFHLSPWLGINVPTIGHGLFFTALGLFVLTGLNSVLLKKSGYTLLPKS
jgi:uncharacterized membrane protein YphA (DoxX/SURF4 family)